MAEAFETKTTEAVSYTHLDVYKRQARKNGDRAFRWMWLTIVLSFGFYIPVVLWSGTYPMVGMLMIPKTCAYVWTVLIGYSVMKKEFR